LADEFGEACDGHVALRFVLDAIDAARYGSVVRGCALAIRAFMREGYFDAVGEAREGYVKLRVVCSEMLEGLAAGGDDCRLQLRGDIVFDAGCVRKVASRSSHGCCQSGIGANL
jgi:hypothetical protein